MGKGTMAWLLSGLAFMLNLIEVDRSLFCVGLLKADSYVAPGTEKRHEVDFMQPSTAILIFGTTLLACGSVSLLVVRLASPRLRGVGLLSAAFATGAFGAGLMMVPATLPLCSVLGADLNLLFSFVLLHVAVLRLVDDSDVPFWHGGLLLGLQALVDGFVMHGVVGWRARVVCLSLLVAVQGMVTAAALWRLAQRQVRAPALFNSVVLFAFVLVNLIRAGLQMFAPQLRHVNYLVSLAVFGLYIAVATGVAFGFFWMTTSMLVGELEHMASTDPLTRLYNRRVFLRWCEKELLRSQRSGVPFSLLMVDLDHFKRVNDNFGHQTGDEVLCAAVEQMQDSVRGIDVLCRWGGEEFAVLLPNAPGEATRLVAERIRENIQKVTHLAARTPAQMDQAIHLTVSIGAATYRDLDDSLTGMIQRADQALYEAKTTGRNRVLLAS